MNFVFAQYKKNEKTSLYKKECLPVITWNKKYSLKQVVSLIYTLGKDFFEAATF